MIPALGRHAALILGAYGVTLALLALLVLVSWRRATRVRARLRQAEAARERKADAEA